MADVEVEGGRRGVCIAWLGASGEVAGERDDA